jgi:glycosyltransferase involved in cell wall biosynthesis
MNIGTTGEIEFQKHAGILAGLGLVKTVATPEGASYEITESGYRFLEEYQDIERDTGGRVLDQLAKDEVSIVIPTMNEAESIGEIVTNIPPGWEVILVDLSTDGTAQKAMSLRPDVRIIRRGPKEVGKGAALRLGLREARGTIVVMMDGDGSHQTSELVKLVFMLEAQNADMVQASRMLRANGSDEMSPHKHPVRYFGNKMVTSLINAVFRSSLTDSQYGFRAFRKEFISKLSLASNDWDIEAEIVVRAAKCRGKIVEIPSIELQRNDGQSRLVVLDFIKVVGRRLLLEVFRR